MSGARRMLCIVYALIAAAALVATWSQNLAYFGDGESPAGLGAFASFILDTKANPASRSITVDIGFFLLAASIFMVVEARRLGVRFVWLYILFGFLVAISVTFPLFMIAREMRRERLTESDQALTMLDVLGLGAVTAAVVWVNWIVLS
jgi:hypothetical protein